MKKTWAGVFPAVTTQMHQDQSLDLDLTARHIETLIDHGAQGLVMLGSLGENVTLTRQEKLNLMQASIEAAAGRVPVLSGVAECSTAAAIEYARELEAIGADGFMLLPAMIYKSDPRETLQHYKAVAKATGLPIICYNNPLAYSVDITPAMFEQLAGIRNFVAIKESSGDVRRITDLINRLGDRFTLFCGVDDLVLESVMLGARGWIAGVGLAFPRENQRLWDLAVAGEWRKARALYRWFMPLLHLDIPIKFVQYIKLAIQEAGMGQEWVRAPRLTLQGAERRRILQVIHAGLETRPLRRASRKQ